MINMLKTKTVTKTKIYNGNKCIGYYTKKKGKKKYKVYSKGILSDLPLGHVKSKDDAMRLIQIHHGIIKVGE